jgi:pimeloyl-ACP methyl ester carboxylesterase
MLSASSIKRGFVEVSFGQVHFRYAGSGPVVVLLHDSPRSSRLHVPLITELADEFTTIALDTPGYGLSTPLPGPQPEIPAFGLALAETLGALGVGRCPVYAFHTSSKIALELAVEAPERVAVVVMDGLSIPTGPPDLDFIRRYMQPFEPSADASHVAGGWCRVRDFHRFFPWFAHTAAARLPMELPDEAHLHDYAIDLFMAGSHYVDAYSAAMRYDPLPAIARLSGPAVFLCREDDVLYAHLDRLPQALPPAVRIERLGADRSAWIERLRELFRQHTTGATGFTAPDWLASSKSERAVQGYVDSDQGQLRVRRQGAGPGRPLLLLHDLPGSGAQLRPLADALRGDRPTYVPDLPGLGESTALDDPDLDAFARSLEGLLDALRLGQADVYAEFLAGPLALALASRAPQRVGRLVLDGLPLPGATERRSLWKHYCPKMALRSDGAHLIALWHRLRDQELAWPWYSRERAAIRAGEPRIGAARLHEMLVDVMKQPASYGDGALAALDCDVRELLARVDHPLLVTRRPADPRYAWAETAARLGRSATLGDWPDALDGRAQVLREFLDA